MLPVKRSGTNWRNKVFWMRRCLSSQRTMVSITENMDWQGSGIRSKFCLFAPFQSIRSVVQFYSGWLEFTQYAVCFDWQKKLLYTSVRNPFAFRLSFGIHACLPTCMVRQTMNLHWMSTWRPRYWVQQAWNHQPWCKEETLVICIYGLIHLHGGQSSFMSILFIYTRTLFPLPLV